MMRFKDRADAGQQLARMLRDHAGSDAVVVALPRGGVLVAAEVARALGAELEIAVVRKLGAPGHEELGIGAVVGGMGGPGASGAAAEPLVVLDEHHRQCERVSESYIAAEVARQVQEIRRREAVYRRGRPPASLAGRVVIVVDDGLATGSTMRAALRGIRRGDRPAKLVLAVPVAAAESLRTLANEADGAVAVLAPESFGAVGAFYDDFSQTTDDQVIGALDRAWAGAGPGGGEKGEPI